MSLIKSGSTWVLTGSAAGELVSLTAAGTSQSLASKVRVTCVSGTGFWRCSPRKSGDTPAIAPVATPLLAAGNLMAGWAPFAANTQAPFGPLRDEGQLGYGELELWGVTAGQIVIEVW